MAEPVTIVAVEAADVGDGTLGRSDGERLGRVLRNLLVHGAEPIEVDFSGVEALTPSGASLMLSRAISADPQALSKVVFRNVPDHLKDVLRESLAGVLDSLATEQ